MQMLNRRRTEPVRRPTLPSERKTGRVQDRYPAYNDFPWEKIEIYLKSIWPDWKDFNQKRNNDNWQFEIPEKLTEGDRRELRNRRDHGRTRGPSQTPEPDMEPASTN